jgi:hypothetical protein
MIITKKLWFCSKNTVEVKIPSVQAFKLGILYN